MTPTGATASDAVEPTTPHRQALPASEADGAVPSPGPSARWMLIGGCATIALTLVLLAGPGMSRGLLNTGDTNNLVAESRTVLDCLRDGELRACGFDAVAQRSRVGPYPLLQYLPAVAMREVGLKPRAILRGLAWVNLVAFVVMLGLLASVAVRSTCRSDQRLWRPVLMVIVASGPLWFYATSGFGEMLAAVLVLGAVLASLHRRPVLTCALALLACLGKETLPPFVLALGILAARDDDDGWLPSKRMLVPLVGGVLGGTALSLGFNVFRYGTIRNVRYLQSQFRTQGLGRVGRNLVELLVAPGGGLVAYWPAVGLLLLAVLVTGLGAARAGERRVAVPIAATLVVLGAFTVGTALWWAPFGWIAWGPRLLLPLVPACVVVGIHVGGPGLTGLVRRGLTAPLVFAAVLVVCVVSAFPQVSAPWSAGVAVSTLRQPDATCPTFGSAGTDEYWRCFDHRAWRLHATPLRTATARDDAITWVVRVAILGGVVLLLFDARSRATARSMRSGADPDDDSSAGPITGSPPGSAGRWVE